MFREQAVLTCSAQMVPVYHCLYEGVLVLLCVVDRQLEAASISVFVQQVVLRATRRPSSCSFEGQYTPRSPDPRTNDENTGPHNSESTQYEDRSNDESTDLKDCGEERRLCGPRSPASTQRGDVSPEQPSWSLGSPLLRYRLIGLVVKASALRAEDPGFESCLRRDFFGVESYQWLQNWHSSGYPVRRLV